MKIRVLRNLGAGLPDHKEGEEVDAKQDVAVQLIEAKLAEPLEPVPNAIEPGEDIPPELVGHVIDGLKRKVDAIALGAANGVELNDAMKLEEMKAALHQAADAKADK